MLGSVVCGSRTWIWTIAAPALAASIEDCAICAGVTGTAGFLLGLSAEPVTAQEMMTLRCIAPPDLGGARRRRSCNPDGVRLVLRSLPRILRCAKAPCVPVRGTPRPDRMRGAV